MDHAAASGYEPSSVILYQMKYIRKLKQKFLSNACNIGNPNSEFTLRW